jgi:hypothetical protein
MRVNLEGNAQVRFYDAPLGVQDHRSINVPAGDSDLADCDAPLVHEG